MVQLLNEDCVRAEASSQATLAVVTVSHCPSQPGDSISPGVLWP